MINRNATSAMNIDEKIYVDINGQKQYLHIYGENVDNPVVLNLHGGPANPDAFLTYEFEKEISNSFTYVSWDQRGCGRTYYKNKKIDPKNQTVSFEQALKDVDALVDYLCKRFHRDKIILMGHSYGSLLGISYVSSYPQKIDKYIGIGQNISAIDTQKLNYQEIMSLKAKDDKEFLKISEAYNRMKENVSFENFTFFQRLTIMYFQKTIINLEKKNQLKLILSSPNLAFDDIRWILQMLNIKEYYAKNKKLFDKVIATNIYDIGNSFFVPMFFLSGEFDKHCRLELLRDYYNIIKAPKKELVIMRNCGHSPQIDVPVLFAKEVKRLLQN